MADATLPGGARFVFRGNAVALGGRIVRLGGQPVSKAIPSPAASSLPVVGGLSRVESDGSSFEDVFTWGPCLAESTGEELENGSHVTVVTSAIKAVSAIHGQIKFEADVLKATVVSEHPRRGQPSIVPKEIIFGSDNGMLLDGKPVRVKLDTEDFQRYSSLYEFERMYRGDEAFFRKYHGRFRRRPARREPVFGERLPRVGSGYAACSIVSGIVWGDKEIDGHILRAEGFGNIYFGELLMEEYDRRLTLVRLHMGTAESSATSEADAGSDEDDGPRADAEVAFIEVDPDGSWEP